MREAAVNVSSAFVYVTLLECIGEYALSKPGRINSQFDDDRPRHKPVDSHSSTLNHIPR